MRTSPLNLTISRIIRQKEGLIALVFCANKLERPLRLPHSQPLPSSRLTENDMSDISMSTPRVSKNSTMFGHPHCFRKSGDEVFGRSPRLVRYAVGRLTGLFSRTSVDLWELRGKDWLPF
ncbi:hypothetical protein GW17_00009943 [Ensete ventricosum]|nr:hypothetical protein GW17_00009943 [Ensete ventricosum]